jgi:hypothetical protein
MAGLSPNDVVDEVLLSEVRLPPPQELTRVTAVPEEDDKDERLKRGLSLLNLFCNELSCRILCLD